jgi:hypothetical protein
LINCVVKGINIFLTPLNIRSTSETNLISYILIINNKSDHVSNKM